MCFNPAEGISRIINRFCQQHTEAASYKMPIKLTIKPTAAQQSKYEVQDVEPSSTVLELKEKVAGQASLAPSEQRLIYKGQILKGACGPCYLGVCVCACIVLRDGARTALCART